MVDFVQGLRPKRAENIMLDARAGNEMLSLEALDILLTTAGGLGGSDDTGL